MNGIIGLKKLFLKNIFRFYEHKNFSNVKKIGTGGFGKVYRANWKNSDLF
jgi:hypothetical protein